MNKYIFIKYFLTIFGILLSSLILSKFIAIIVFPGHDIFNFYSVSATFKLTFYLLTSLFIGYSLSLVMKPWFQNFEIKIFHLIFTGQIFFTIFLLVRSVTNFILTSIGFNIVNLGIFDFFTLFVISILLILFNKKRYKFKINFFSDTFRNYILLKNLVYLILFLSFALLIISTETPRASPLSTDPNIHSYFVNLISRFGTSFYQFVEDGVQPQEYPSGFSLVNFQWSFLTELSSLDVVTVQTSIQLLITIFIIAELIFSFTKKKKIFDSLIVPVSLFFIFYFIIPYGYQPSNFHLEGTARLSLLSAYAYLFSGLMILFNKKINKKNEIKIEKLNRGSIYLLYLTLIYVFIINPINSLIFFSMFILNILIYRKYLKSLLLAIIILSPLMLFDSFTINKIMGITEIKNIQNVPFTSDNKTVPNVFVNGEELVQYIYLQVNDVFKFDDIVSLNFLFILSLVFILLRENSTNLLKYTSLKKNISIQFSITIISFLLITMVIYYALKIFNVNASYLIQPYFNFSVIQTLLILFFISLSFISLQIYNYKKINLFLIIFLIFSIHYLNVSITKPYPRIGIDGSIGSVTKNDIDVLQYIEKHYHNTTNDPNSYIDYKNSPKTLLLSMPVNAGPEKWIFPLGGATVYPLFKTYPPAFFYGFGSKKYSQENYLALLNGQNIEEFLKSINVSYVYVQEDYNDVNELLNFIQNNSEVIYQAGDSYFLKLSI